MIMARLMKLEVLTPEKILVKREDISYVLLNTVTGGVGVLANHGPMIAVLGEGTLKLQDKDNHVILVYVEGGFAEVKDNQVVILTPRAQRAEKIDVAKDPGRSPGPAGSSGCPHRCGAYGKDPAACGSPAADRSPGGEGGTLSPGQRINRKKFTAADRGGIRCGLYQQNGCQQNGAAAAGTGGAQ